MKRLNLNNKIIGVTLASLVATTLVPSAAIAAEKEIVAIYKSGTQQYFIDQADGFSAAAEELGYSAKIINVEMDANLAITAVSDAIASGAKGIAITAPDQSLGAALSIATAEAGVLMVATDDPLTDSDGNSVPFVGFDGTAMGTEVGMSAGNLLKASGWLDGGSYGILSVEVQTLSVCNDRTDAAKVQVLAAGASQDSIVSVSYDGTTDASLAASGPVITANPSVDKWVVFACNDEGVLGATNALRNAGFAPDDVIAVGLGAYEACLPWKAGIPSGFKSALYLSGVDVGKAAARALIESIDNGTDLPQYTVADTTIVDPSNYADIMPCG